MSSLKKDDLLRIGENANSELAVFNELESAARALGFDYCAYGMRGPFPVATPRIVMMNNYPRGWRERYAEANYVATDPTVQHGIRSEAAILWTDSLFSGTRDLWGEARASGLRVGWCQSSHDIFGVGGMFTLARSHEEISDTEREDNELCMQWLATIAHVRLSRFYLTKDMHGSCPSLTPREVEVLKWTSDGKTSSEISCLLSVSENTVNFHIKNAVRKLNTVNKTAAVVRAALLGLLHAESPATKRLRQPAQRRHL